MAIVLPDSPLLRTLRKRGVTYISIRDLSAYLYKAATDPEQSPESGEAYRMLAEMLEESC